MVGLIRFAITEERSFLDIRDRYGKTQVVVAPESGPEKVAIASGLRGEDVVRITGVVAKRLEGKQNDKLSTGEIELRATDVEILNRSLTPPSSPTRKSWREKI